MSSLSSSHRLTQLLSWLFAFVLLSLILAAATMIGFLL